MLRCTTIFLFALAQTPPHDITFTQASEGKFPPGWKEERTGTGEGSVWKVTADATGPGGTGFVLAQTAAGPKTLYNLCVYQDATLKDLELEVAFKAHMGVLDQGGGLIWRYKDANNYYLARMNPLEDNFRVYKVEGGKRTQLQTVEKIKIAVDTWHTIKIRQTGDTIACYLDGKKELEVQDTTFPAAGKIGLWTKADAQTYFDRFRWTDLGKK